MSADIEKYIRAMTFSWLEDDRIAGCRGARTDADLAFLASKGIRALVRLAYEEETGITAHEVEAAMLEDCYEPVEDFHPPSQTQIDRVIEFVRNALAHGKPVAVSCGAGYGRTGTILACYIVSLGHTAEQAIELLISIRPESEEILRVPGQKEAIIEFARRLHPQAV